jgi:hypothetical protein
MTTNRTPIGARRRRKLMLAQKNSLITGESGAESPAFRSDDARHEAWQRHRETLLKYCQGTRPAAWWDYEAPISFTSDRDYEGAVLFEAKLLADHESALLLKTWRERFEQVQEPWFDKVGFCTGTGWLMGETGRQAHYKWAGIPPKLVKKWAAERKRRDRTIAKLQADSQPPAA